MQIDVKHLLKKEQKLFSVALLGFSILLAVVLLWRIQNFLKVSMWARVVVNSAVQQIDIPTPDTTKYLSPDKEIVAALIQDNIFILQATPVSPISEVRAIFGDSALINGKWYKTGDSIGQARIVAIEPSQARIEWNGTTKTYSPVEASI
jgi:hypothetical protein